jgi:hypothetical protein
MDIDLVITWVNGQDAAWREQFEKTLSEFSYVFPEDEFAIRYDAYDDLNVGLRTVDLFANDVFRKIWIVHDPIQKPKASLPNVFFVSHDEIMPRENLPTYNSLAIEAHLHKIPGLAEHFVYANDDFFFRGKVSADLFFLEDKPRVFASCPVKPLDEVLANETELNGWQFSLSYTNTLLNARFTPEQAPDRYLRIHPAHMHVPMSIEICKAAWKYFEAELETLSSYRLRPLAIFEQKLVATITMLFPWVGLELGLAVMAGKPKELGCTYPKMGEEARNRALAHILNGPN